MKTKTKFKIVTFGCVANRADTQIMKNILIASDFEESEKPDIIIFNTCGVKGVTENKIIDEIKKFQSENIIIAGCLTKISGERLKKEFPKASMMGPDQILDIVKIVERVIKKEKVIDLSSKCCERVNFLQEDTEIVPISQGCSGNCLYCATKFARGNLHSYPIEKILKAIRNSKEKIIYLTSQDNGCYGLDIHTNLSNLLKEIVKVDRNFVVRVGMMNPNNVLNFLNELVQIYKNSKIMKFVHIPIQSGSNKVLKEMNRNYTVEDFKHIVGTFRKEIPEIHIATDIIVGYPTESEEDFQKTLSLLEDVKPEVINISKFYSRPNTVAAELKQLSSKIIKERSKRLSILRLELRKQNKKKSIFEQIYF